MDEPFPSALLASLPVERTLMGESGRHDRQVDKTGEALIQTGLSKSTSGFLSLHFIVCAVAPLAPVRLLPPLSNGSRCLFRLFSRLSSVQRHRNACSGRLYTLPLPP